jgi:hypothetical protein
MLVMICYVRIIDIKVGGKYMTDDELKALVASLAVANKNLHEAYYLNLDCSKAKARLNWIPNGA